MLLKIQESYNRSMYISRYVRPRQMYPIYG